MGRRKTAQKKLKKKRPEIASTFKCLFCNHEKAVTCTLNHKDKIGELACRICGEGWQTRINYLTEPIDVFSAWLDATEAEAEVDTEERRPQGRDEDEEYGQADAADELL